MLSIFCFTRSIYSKKSSCVILWYSTQLVPTVIVFSPSNIVYNPLLLASSSNNIRRAACYHCISGYNSYEYLFGVNIVILLWCYEIKTFLCMNIEHTNICFRCNIYFPIDKRWIGAEKQITNRRRGKFCISFLFRVQEALALFS